MFNSDEKKSKCNFFSTSENATTKKRAILAVFLKNRLLLIENNTIGTNSKTRKSRLFPFAYTVFWHFWAKKEDPQICCKKRIFGEKMA
jgi:hypothetical protein